MKLIVNPHKIEIVKELVNEKEIDITKCEFEFSEEITDDFVKEAYFTLNNETYKQIIENNECKIPYEVLKEKGQVEIGCVAFLIENEQEIKRYNPSPVYISTLVGSLKDEFENSEPITPTDKEQIEQMLNNINVDANKEGKITTITITFKDGTTKDVTLEDGMGIDYNWVGTQLGIKREDEQEYEYVDLKGEKGDAGAIRMRIVQELPFVGDEDTMYLVPLEEPETEDNRYAEYIYVNNQWELLGKIGIQVDLSGYYTKNQVYNKEETDQKVNAKYTKPSDGIPKEDLSQSVQASLNKADSSIQDVSDKEDKSNKVTSLSSSSTNDQYPSAKCVYDSQETQNNDIQDLQEENNELKGIINNIYDIDNYLIKNYSIESEETTENITLNNTMNKAPMSLTLKGNIEQDSTTGKNLLHTTLTSQTKNNVNVVVNDDGTIKLNGTSNANFDVKWFEGSLTLQAGTYYFGLGTTTDQFNLYYRANGQNTILANPVSKAYYQVTLNEETTITSINSYVISGKTLNNVTFYPMICTSLPFDYEPYTGGNPSPSPDYPQDIHIVSGDNEIKVCNKNLVSSYAKIGNLIYLNGASRYEDYIFKAGTYTLSYKNSNNVSVIMKDTTGEQKSLGTAKTITFTSNYDFNIWFYRSGITIEEFSEVQLEVGSTATSYVEHQEYTKEINLGELEVGSIREYEDEFFKNTIDSEYYDSTLLQDKWYLKKRIGKVVLDGSEDWTYQSSYPRFTYYFGNAWNAGGENHRYSIISNFYKYVGDGNNNGTGFIYGKSIYLCNTNISSASDFQTWLSTHNTIVYYVLATPENILLNDTLQETLDSFVSYQEQTNISQSNNDLPFVIKARAIKEIL